MFYQINVSLNGRHFFETDLNSIPDKVTMEKMYKVFKEKFPQKEGYDILVWDMVGKFVDTNYLNNEVRLDIENFGEEFILIEN